MAILVRCSACGAEFRANAKHRGKEAPCAKCGKPLVVDGEAIPDHDVFISYSSNDKHAADAICATLEAKRWRCWIAPRNVLPGSDWGAAIIDAIEQSRVMVLVYSGHANTSQQVLREIERAVSKAVPIIPFRIEAVPPSKNMEYFLSTSHWMDAMTRPLAEHIEELAQSVKGLLKAARDDSGPQDASGPVGVLGAALPGMRAARGRRWAAVAAGVLLAAGVGIAGAAAYIRSQARHAGGATRPAAAAAAATLPATAPATPPAKAVGITERKVLVERRSFQLAHGRRDLRIPIQIPEIASGSGWMQINIEDMGDNSGDMGMFCLIFDASGSQVFKRFGKVTQTFTFPVKSGTSWTVSLQDYDTGRGGNGGQIEIAVAPK